MLACGALVSTPLVALPGGGTPTVALTASLTNMAMARAALSDSTALSGRSRVNSTIRVQPGVNLRAIIHTQASARGIASYLLTARMAVNIRGLGQAFVVRLVSDTRLPLFFPLNNTYWPGTPIGLGTVTTINPLQAEDSIALLTEDGNILEIE